MSGWLTFAIVLWIGVNLIAFVIGLFDTWYMSRKPSECQIESYAGYAFPGFYLGCLFGAKRDFRGEK